MRINMMIEQNNKHNTKLLKWICSQAKGFSKDYDLNFNSSIRHILNDKNLSALFCSWMGEQGLLNIKPYSLELETGEPLAKGFEIVEDELLTMRLLSIP